MFVFFLFTSRSLLNERVTAFCFAGTMERVGGEGVDHAVGIVLGPPVVSVAHGLAQILRAALDSHRFGGRNDAQQGPVELHVRAHIAGFVRHRVVQVNIVFFIFKFEF